MKDLRYLPYLERVACQSALDIVRRHKTPGSEQKDFITQHTKLREHWHLCFLAPHTSMSHRETQFSGKYAVSLSLKLGESATFAVSSKQACSLCAEEVTSSFKATCYRCKLCYR